MNTAERTANPPQFSYDNSGILALKTTSPSAIDFSQGVGDHGVPFPPVLVGCKTAVPKI